MRGLTKIAAIDNGYNLVVTLRTDGDVFYRIEGTTEWHYSHYTIMESVHNYYVARNGNRLDKMMQGTKKECLEAITELLRTVFTLCKGRN